MSSTVTKALRGLYKEMTGNEAAGNSTVKVLNEIATAMGASSKHTSVTQCIDEIAANYDSYIESLVDAATEDSSPV